MTICGRFKSVYTHQTCHQRCLIRTCCSPASRTILGPSCVLPLGEVSWTSLVSMESVSFSLALSFISFLAMVDVKGNRPCRRCTTSSTTKEHGVGREIGQSPKRPPRRKHTTHDTREPQILIRQSHGCREPRRYRSLRAGAICEMHKRSYICRRPRRWQNTTGRRREFAKH